MQIQDFSPSVNHLKNLYVGRITVQINVRNYLEKAQKRETKLHTVIILVRFACIVSRKKKGKLI